VLKIVGKLYWHIHISCMLTHRVCLIFPVVEIVAVVENVLIGGVEASFYTVLHHLTRPGGTLQLLDLNTDSTQRMAESKTL